jgi:hypothetical protein
MTRHLRGVLCAAVVAAAAAPDSAAQEVTVHLAVGARAATTLVHDSIVVPIVVRARPGPAVALGADLALDSTWTARLTLDAAWNALAGHAAGAPTSELGTIRTVAATLTLHRRLRRGLHGGLTVGVLGYGGGRGPLARGGPGLTAAGGALLRYEPKRAGRRFALEARYDVHRFITPALRDVGFTASRPVHRLALLLSARVAGAAR